MGAIHCIVGLNGIGFQLIVDFIFEVDNVISHVFLGCVKPRINDGLPIVGNDGVCPGLAIVGVKKIVEFHFDKVDL